MGVAAGILFLSAQEPEIRMQLFRDSRERTWLKWIKHFVKFEDVTISHLVIYHVARIAKSGR